MLAMKGELAMKQALAMKGLDKEIWVALVGLRSERERVVLLRSMYNLIFNFPMELST